MQSIIRASCRLLLNNTKLDRAKKRTLATTTTEEMGYKKQRRSSSCSKLHCFLCDKEDKDIHLRQAMTMKLNDRLTTVAHKCHGKSKFITAKANSSRQEQIRHGKSKLSTARANCPGQEQIHHGKSKYLPTARANSSRQKTKI